MTQPILPSNTMNQIISISNGGGNSPISTTPRNPNDTLSSVSLSGALSFREKIVQFFRQISNCLHGLFPSLCNLLTCCFGRGSESSITEEEPSPTASEDVPSSTTSATVSLPHLGNNQQSLRVLQQLYSSEWQAVLNGLELVGLRERFQNIQEGREPLTREISDQISLYLRQASENGSFFRIQGAIHLGINDAWQFLWENSDQTERDQLVRIRAGLIARDRNIESSLEEKIRWLLRPTAERIAHNRARVNSLRVICSVDDPIWNIFMENPTLQTLYQRMSEGAVQCTASSLTPIGACLNNIRSFQNDLIADLNQLVGGQNVRAAIAALPPALSVPFQRCRLGIQVCDAALNIAIRRHVNSHSNRAYIEEMKRTYTEALWNTYIQSLSQREQQRFLEPTISERLIAPHEKTQIQGELYWLNTTSLEDRIRQNRAQLSAICNQSSPEANRNGFDRNIWNHMLTLLSEDERAYIRGVEEGLLPYRATFDLFDRLTRAQNSYAMEQGLQREAARQAERATWERMDAAGRLAYNQAALLRMQQSATDPILWRFFTDNLRNSTHHTSAVWYREALTGTRMLDDQLFETLNGLLEISRSNFALLANLALTFNNNQAELDAFFSHFTTQGTTQEVSVFIDDLRQGRAVLAWDRGNVAPRLTLAATNHAFINGLKSTYGETWDRWYTANPSNQPLLTRALNGEIEIPQTVRNRLPQRLETMRSTGATVNSTSGTN